MDEMVKNPYIA